MVVDLIDYTTLCTCRARRALAKAYSALNDRAHEYRLVTKRLLGRFKDRAPAPLNRLDILLETVQVLFFIFALTTYLSLHEI